MTLDRTRLQIAAALHRGTRILQTIQLHLRRLRTSADFAARPNLVSRWKRVPGAASEPHCIAAGFTSADDIQH
jgi:hypothetical protein